MTEKEYPIFAFEERKRFGLDIDKDKEEIDLAKRIFESWLLDYKIVQRTNNVLIENISHSWKNNSVVDCQISLYKDYILLNFVIIYPTVIILNEFCFKIENCNKLFLEEGNEGLKNMYKTLIKEKFYSETSIFFTFYNLSFIDCIRKSKNPIQVEKTDQEQTLKITYKIDL